MPRLAIAAAALLIGTAGVLHFTDDPAPDLSRFSRPAIDPVAYAKVKALCEEFETRHKAYAPQEPGDPDDEKAEDDAHTLDGLALRGDANAVRALRRHLKENEAALVVARELVALKTFSYEPTTPGNPLSMPMKEITAIKEAHRLFLRTALLAGIDGKTGPAWAMLGDCLAAARTREKATTNLITGLVNLACESFTRQAANTLAAFETDPANLRAFLIQMDRHAPDPLCFRQAFEGETLLFADATMPSRGASSKKLLDWTGISAPNFSSSLPGLESVQRQWLRWNFLPNATMTAYAHRMDEELAATGPVATVTPLPTNDGLRILLRNAGGRATFSLFADSIQFVRERYFANRAHHDLTRVALALRVYQLEHEGRRPATLAELAPAILPAVPADPFDGKALRYDAASGKVWSVGADLKDGGGDKENDLVVAPPERGPAAR